MDTTAKNNTNGKPVMTKDHLEAMAEGRHQGRIVREYLEALDSHRPKRGRKRTPEMVQRRLDTIEKHLLDAKPLERLMLIQEKLDLLQAQEFLLEEDFLQVYENAFVEVAAAFSERKDISFEAWREAGVPAEVLKRAGVGKIAAAA